MATWNIDTTHSGANFSVKHMMFTTVRGKFDNITGTVEFDPAHPEDARVNAVIDASTVNTGVADRDNHLRSPDFFNVEQFPHLTFESTGFRSTGENKGVLTGELTIAGVTKTVELDVEMLGQGKDPWGNQRVGFNGNTKINREDFGLTWNQALETGGWLVGKDINIELEIQAILVPETENA